ncbi:MAG: exodeoxyribonuclease VII small subunit [Pseudomonadota bacterium]
MSRKTENTPSFEAALVELEKVVADMEAGQLPLEEVLAAYQRGSELLLYCRGRLEEAQQQVRILEEGSLKNFQITGDTSAS